MTRSLEELETFLTEKRDAREYRRVLAVKMALKGYAYDVLCDILSVTPGFISQSKKAYEEHGIPGLLLKYKGSQSFLSSEERQAVIAWLEEQQEWNVDQLKSHIQDTYGVVFQSRQSYYDLFAAANITWKKAQRMNPRRDPALVAAKKKRLVNSLSAGEQR
jgi:putative transposase